MVTPARSDQGSWYTGEQTTVGDRTFETHYSDSTRDAVIYETTGGQSREFATYEPSNTDTRAGAPESSMHSISGESNCIIV